jgi:hypothetical protein
MPEEGRNGFVKKLLKALGIVAVVLLVLAIVAFGLIVGVCGLAGKR